MSDTRDAASAAQLAIRLEYEEAVKRFPAMHSPHEGWAVIREEMDELWTHVRANTGQTDEAKREAIQIAAMALRYIVDLCSTDPLLMAILHDPPDEVKDELRRRADG